MIVITTPTGQIASQVLSQLIGGEEPLRLVVRDPSRLPAGTTDRAEVITGSHGDPAVIDRALADADALFWVAPSLFSNDDVYAQYVDFTRPAAEAIRRHGVARVVAVSALGRGYAKPAGLVTASIEMTGLLDSTGAATRALACAGFMDNLLRSLGTLREPGVFYGTTPPDLAVPHIATADIATAGAALLADHDWAGHADVPLIGPEDLSFNQVAATLSEVLGTQITYQQTSLEDLRGQLLGRGASPGFTQGMVEMMAAKDDGMDLLVPRTPDAVGATTLRQWAEAVLIPALTA